MYMPNADPSHGPKYQIDVEGKLYPWDKDTITTEEIADLGGWAVSQGVIEIDKDNNERTLAPGETVELKPGHGFSKKVKWKRGDDLSRRVQDELALLRTRFPDLEYSASNGGWIRIPSYPLPPGWSSTTTEVAVQIPKGYPGAEPYGIYVPVGLKFKDAMPNNYTQPAGNAPPFEGAWGVFSWAPNDGEWKPTASIHSGPNLLNYILGFATRFREGA